VKINSDESIAATFPTQMTDLWGYESQHFDSVELDYNHDGHLDKIYSHKFLEGDSLFVYRNMNEKYVLSLATYNFTEDGLYVIDSIGIPTDTSLGDLTIFTHFNGSGGMQQDVYLTYQTPDTWRISYTHYAITECLNEYECIDKCCLIRQNLALTDTTNWEDYTNTLVWEICD
jgi:hypothetical protein